MIFDLLIQTFELFTCNQIERSYLKMNFFKSYLINSIDFFEFREILNFIKNADLIYKLTYSTVFFKISFRISSYKALKCSDGWRCL
ncbi:hypothetical protein BpHYR1_002829 [Brachionus plicatilis]|uniref:Uncharacterized protein n=1 Tax=Brachionus plicatilis TaxID=10195 RepID=A0A3M7SS25_BRAPC|nr:hypothetical protein BpHYR1_002829 [Brachionus plicatilis]